MINKAFFDALGLIESSNNPKAIGDNGKSIGIYQIRASYFKDAQEFNPKLRKYSHKDCFNPEIAREVVKAYMRRYCKNGSNEDMARCHNSGPGWKKKFHLTNKYIRKFRAALNKSVK